MPADALARIRARGHIGIRLGLARMRALLAQLDDPQLALRGTLIGGTNGKGSVAAMVASILGAAGYSTSQSPSPHLHTYRERITVNGQPIAADDLDALLEEVLRASEPSATDHGPATEFELLTAAAYLWSARQRVDVVVMEVGLGGRLDASNTWDAGVAAITNVGLDHEEFLGDTIASVAAEKAAIIKPGQRAVSGARGEALEVIRARAAELDVPLAVCPPLPVLGMDRSGIRLDHARLGALHLPLLGRHQAANAAVALGVIDALDDAGIASADGEAIRSGLALTRWPGRLELLDRDGQTILLDGAHNPDGALALAATFEELAGSLPPGRPTLLTGVMADKEVAEMLRALAGSESLRAARFIAAGVPDTDRTLPAVDLARMWFDVTGSSADAALDDADAALDHALETAAAEGGPLVIAGSLYLVGHLRPRLVLEAAGLGDA
ncbi:MAG: folylpolyglutamate synthase/dihydrofolate synthase family protein [Chloroflexota bacterium]|nr:folylpolyglutamate synthase/dihydrofolate synthase family protein [Chloroflexota bacterium]